MRGAADWAEQSHTPTTSSYSIKTMYTHSTDLQKCFRVSDKITDPSLRSIGLTAIIRATINWLKKQEAKKFCETIMAEKNQWQM